MLSLRRAAVAVTAAVLATGGLVSAAGPAEAYPCSTGQCASVYNNSVFYLMVSDRLSRTYRLLPPATSSRNYGIRDAAFVHLLPNQCATREVRLSSGFWSRPSGITVGEVTMGFGRVDLSVHMFRCSDVGIRSHSDPASRVLR